VAPHPVTGAPLAVQHRIEALPGQRTRQNLPDIGARAAIRDAPTKPEEIMKSVWTTGSTRTQSAKGEIAPQMAAEMWAQGKRISATDGRRFT
jgi:hypothetical protein